MGRARLFIVGIAIVVMLAVVALQIGPAFAETTVPAGGSPMSARPAAAGPLAPASPALSQDPSQGPIATVATGLGSERAIDSDDGLALTPPPSWINTPDSALNPSGDPAEVRIADARSPP